MVTPSQISFANFCLHITAIYVVLDFSAVIMNTYDTWVFISELHVYVCLSVEKGFKELAIFASSSVILFIRFVCNLLSSLLGMYLVVGYLRHRLRFLHSSTWYQTSKYPLRFDDLIRGMRFWWLSRLRKNFGLPIRLRWIKKNLLV